jgi:hypothetical protein
MTVTAKELAHILGLSERRIRDLVASGTVRKSGDGLFDLPEAVQSYCKFLKSSKGASLAEARKRKVDLESELLERELAIRNGELVAVKPLAERVSKALSAIKNNIELAANLEREDKNKIVASCQETWLAFLRGTDPTAKPEPNRVD